MKKEMKSRTKILRNATTDKASYWNLDQKYSGPKVNSILRIHNDRNSILIIVK